jgi:hypothetical protein
LRVAVCTAVYATGSSAGGVAIKVAVTFPQLRQMIVLHAVPAIGHPNDPVHRQF